MPFYVQLIPVDAIIKTMLLRFMSYMPLPDRCTYIASPRRPASTMRIFFSALNLRRVRRFISRIIESEVGFRLFFVVVILFS
ncbi:MAG: hypothetical protein JRD02_00015 [Deltaproteobacteria bacterium]|nr:hypothetical protein [Deltaproteobacteria bacterium]